VVRDEHGWCDRSEGGAGPRVVEGEKGLFVAVPQRKGPNGQFRDIAHPATADMRQVINASVIDGYNRALERGERPREVTSRSRG